MLLAAIMMVSLAGARGMVPLCLKLMNPNVMPARSNLVIAQFNVNMSRAVPPAPQSLAMYYSLRGQQTSPSPTILDALQNQLLEEKYQSLEEKCVLLEDSLRLQREIKGLLEKELDSAVKSTPAALTLHHSAPCPRPTGSED